MNKTKLGETVNERVTKVPFKFFTVCQSRLNNTNTYKNTKILSKTTQSIFPNLKLK
jgi:hypothetical protein